MKQIIYSLQFIAALLLSSQGFSQSLPDLINTALDKNYQIKIYKNNLQLATNNNTLGNAGQLPSVDLNGTYSNSYNNTVQQFSDGSTREGSNALNTNLTASVLANWTLFNGFKVIAKKDELAYLERLGQLNSKFYIEQTVSDIVSAYHQLAYENMVLENYKNSLKISEFRLALESKRREVGSGTYIDYGQALVDYQTDSIRLLKQENTISALIIDFNAVLNNNLENSISITNHSFDTKPLPSKSALLKLIEESSLQLDQERIKELIAETNVRMQKADRVPKIDLFAGYQYARSTSAVGFFNSNQNYGPTFGVTVSFNLFNGGATNRAIKNADLFYDNSSLTKKDVENNLDASVLKLYNEYLSINKRLDIAKSNVEGSRKVNNIAKEQLKQGLINGYDFRTAQLTLLNSELVLLQLKLSLKAIEVSLNRVSGKVLERYL